MKHLLSATPFRHSHDWLTRPSLPHSLSLMCSRNKCLHVKFANYIIMENTQRVSHYFPPFSLSLTWGWLCLALAQGQGQAQGWNWRSCS